MITLLDGPLGTELEARGVPPVRDCWSAGAIETAPETITAIHRDYAQNGCAVHTANTFRTNRRASGDSWRARTLAAVALTKEAVPKHHRVAGSIAPVEDCYRPDLSPGSKSGPEHYAMATTLAEAGCDLLLCETFSHPEETLAATKAAVSCNLETWVALTAGPNTNLMTPQEMAQLATQAVNLGANAVLVNCTPAADTQRFLEAIIETAISVPVGAYANAGSPDDNIGWRADCDLGYHTYAKFAKSWVDAGATILGGCCGTGPRHLAAIQEQLGV
ncbi:MAG: homocysteine methyltransferase [Rhodopirellula sp.]|nr:homocysteine methyltransferase [Rhodopirellula sp.]